MTSYTYEMAMEAVTNGASIAEAFAPFLAAADAACVTPRSKSTLNYRNIGFKNDVEGRILDRDERMVARLDGIA